MQIDLTPYTGKNFIISSEAIVGAGIKFDITKKGEKVYIVNVLLQSLDFPIYFKDEEKAYKFFNEKIKPNIK
jgi:hypothetical protein